VGCGRRVCGGSSRRRGIGDEAIDTEVVDWIEIAFMVVAGSVGER
jgi:hypothetical protein